MLTQKDFDELEKTFVTKTDLKESLSTLKSDIFTKLDAFIKEIRSSRQERTLASRKLSNHEDRITVLEDASS